MSDLTAQNYSVLIAVLRQEYPASNLEALKKEIRRVTLLAIGSQVVLNASSSEGASQSGQIVLTRIDYLGVLIDLQKEIDPDFVHAPGSGVIRYADHSCRYAE